MEEVKSICQRLYLAKGDTLNIHIDVPLPQHQKDGIRFLYRQFSKKKPGVILNDPSGYGKRVQTVLFINAMRPQLDKPVLVLCKEGSQDKWSHLFHKWTNLGDEVSIHLSNPPVLRSWVYINPMSQVASFSRREWSLVVIDCTVSREVLRAGTTARFKVWITSVDLKKNLQTFSSIYKWLYPKGKFNVDDFQATAQKPSVVLSKSIILDALMEDIVIRRKGDFTTHGKTEEAVYTPPKLTRKNKDATGTKIKRSKRRIIDDSPTDDVPLKIAKDDDFALNANNYCTQNDNKSDEDKHDNEIQNDLLNNLNQKCNEITENAVVQNENFNHVTEKSNELSKNIENEINNVQNKDILMQSDEIKLNNVNYSEMKCNNTEENCDLSNNSAIGSQDIVIHYDSDTTVESVNDSSEKLNIDEINGVDAQKSQDLFSNVDEMNDITKSPDVNSNTTTEKVNNGNGKADCDDIVDNNPSDIESKNELSVSEVKTEPELSGIELKMKQLEELTMKKFKGSLLDSIF